MSTPVLPTIIRGPAIVIWDGFSYYTAGDITVKRTRPTFEVTADMWGKIDTRVAGQAVVELEFTPVGEMKSLAKFYPYGPSSLVAACAVGTSVFGTPAKPLVIHTKAGQTITYHRAGMTRMPALQLSPKKTLFGPMSFTALGKAATQPTDAAFLKTIGAAGFTDATFDPAKVITDIYRASLGTRGAPFNAMGAREGFVVTPSLEFADAMDDNLGMVDRFIQAITWRCQFAPNNLTEAQLDELFMDQGSDVLLPGQSVARAGEDLVIDSDALTVTLHTAGPVSAEQGYGTGVDRNGNVEFATRMAFATGAPQPLVSMVIH